MTDPDLYILIPVYNDYTSLFVLAGRIQEVLEREALRAVLVIADDGSAELPPWPENGRAWSRLSRIQQVVLKRNVGHQSAIAIGLYHLSLLSPECPVIVMDGDGEDDPAYIPDLFQKYRETRAIVFCRRARRSESVFFRLFYLLYKLIFHLATGRSISFGNFSLLPARHLPRLISYPELWWHFAATIIKAGMPYTSIATRRRKRIAGRPAMNLYSLITHAIKSMMVFGEIVIARFLFFSVLVILFSLAAIGAVIAIKLFTELAIPGWASYLLTGFLNIMVLAVSISILNFFILSRHLHIQNSVITGEYARYIDRVDVIR